MSGNTEKFGENSSKILRTMIKSNMKMLTSVDLEGETRLSADKVQDAMGWLIKSSKVSAVRDIENNMRYVLIDGTYEKNASVVWKSLSDKGPQNIASLRRNTSLTEEEIHGALGWLARENDIDYTAKGNLKTYTVL